MEWVKLTRDNLEQEHICCAISDNRDVQVLSKKAWLKDRLADGLVFLKADARGKCFIEYLPAENAWTPIAADGYMYIDCLWVSGQFKGHGYAAELLDACKKDSEAKGKKGLVILSSPKKMGFLSDHKYMASKGFLLADTADPYYELLYLPFDKNAEKPRFRDCVKDTPRAGMEKGFTLYYTDQCPFTAKYVPILIAMAEENHAAMRAVHIQTKEQAQDAPTPFTTFALFYDGVFLTHEIQSEKKFAALLQKVKEA